MEKYYQNLLTAAEASFEMDPSPNMEKFWCNIWCNMKIKNMPDATQVQQQKRTKTMQNSTKHKKRKGA